MIKDTGSESDDCLIRNLCIELTEKELYIYIYIYIYI